MPLGVPRNAEIYLAKYVFLLKIMQVHDREQKEKKNAEIKALSKACLVAGKVKQIPDGGKQTPSKNFVWTQCRCHWLKRFQCICSDSRLFESVGLNERC